MFIHNNCVRAFSFSFILGFCTAVAVCRCSAEFSEHLFFLFRYFGERLRCVPWRRHRATNRKALAYVHNVRGARNNGNCEENLPVALTLGANANECTRNVRWICEHPESDKRTEQRRQYVMCHFGGKQTNSKAHAQTSKRTKKRKGKQKFYVINFARLKLKCIKLHRICSFVRSHAAAAAHSLSLFYTRFESGIFTSLGTSAAAAASMCHVCSCV